MGKIKLRGKEEHIELFSIVHLSNNSIKII